MKIRPLTATVFFLSGLLLFVPGPLDAQDSQQALADYDAAVKALRSGSFKEAEKKLDSAGKTLSDIPELQLGAGLAKLANGKYGSAVNSLNAAAKSSNNATAAMALACAGKALMAQGKLDEAIISLNDALQRDNAHEMAKTLLARCYILQERYTLAIPLLSGLVHVHPGDGDLLSDMAYVFFQSGQTQAARKYYQMACDLGEPSPGLQYNLAVVLAATGALDRAITQLEALLASGSEAVPAQAYKNLALLKKAKGLDAEAEALLREYGALNPEATPTP